ncbi:hypothetical protein SLA2020_432780 [Shorea laevis]
MFWKVRVQKLRVGTRNLSPFLADQRSKIIRHMKNFMELKVSDQLAYVGSSVASECESVLCVAELHVTRFRNFPNI